MAPFHPLPKSPKSMNKLTLNKPAITSEKSENALAEVMRMQYNIHEDYFFMLNIVIGGSLGHLSGYIWVFSPKFWEVARTYL